MTRNRFLANRYINKIKDIKRIIFGAYGYEYTSHPLKIAPVLMSARGIIKNSNGEYLLVQRSKNDRKDPLLWEFPGGKIDRDEYDPTNTLRNEIKQETNLEIKIVKGSPYCMVRKSTMQNKSYENFILVTLYYKCIPNTTNVKISFEHEKYRWVKLDSIDSNLVLTDSTINILQSGFVDNF